MTGVSAGAIGCELPEPEDPLGAGGPAIEGAAPCPSPAGAAQVTAGGFFTGPAFGTVEEVEGVAGRFVVPGTEAGGVVVVGACEPSVPSVVGTGGLVVPVVGVGGFVPPAGVPVVEPDEVGPGATDVVGSGGVVEGSPVVEVVPLPLVVELPVPAGLVAPPPPAPVEEVGAVPDASVPAVVVASVEPDVGLVVDAAAPAVSVDAQAGAASTTGLARVMATGTSVSAVRPGRGR